MVEQGRLPIFAERFADLRGKKTQGEFAEFLGISRPTVGFYENGTRIPDALVLRQIAERCNVSADWLIGLSNIKLTKANEETAASLELPERFIEETCFRRDRSLVFETETLKGLLASDGFWSAIEAISGALLQYVEGKDSLREQIPVEEIEEIHEMDMDVRNVTDNIYGVFRRSWLVDGLKFKAQEAFNAAVELILQTNAAKFGHHLEKE